MATGAWEAWQVPASARCVLTSDGKATVSSATEDIGTGTYTIMTQIAAEVLGLPIEQVTFALGDSSMPSAPLEGGSFTASSVGSAVKAVCEKVRERLVALGLDPSKPVAFGEGMRHAKLDAIDEQVSVQPSHTQRQYGLYSHSAVFAEVRVDEDLGTVHVARVVTAVAPGRVLNPKTARSQVMGGIVWGIGMALEEEGVIDHAFGRIMNHSLAEYHVAVNADIHDIDVIFVEEQDDIVNPLGVKGLGEIGVVGVAAAIANAVFHATGKRIRELPITLDKLI
jgi:xanthine dehydrogenase YagR molybdenum-binding subunit